ncbi:MAG: efflux RND transporter periplasmic adaptor subunit [Planctomycetes bacterium]|nr:efflux RND transporter periplasmic adaptor subunit [Planctomycetota bacterium]
MADLKDELASLRIDRRATVARGRGPLLAGGLLAVLAAVYLAWRALEAPGTLEVETARAEVVAPGAAARGMPVLTASGYVVARRKAVVSAKIQGRLSELRVEEGSRVSEGDVIARLESSDFEAQVERAKAAVERAEAELEESRRQHQLAESQSKDGIVSEDQLDQARSRVRIGEAALRQARADLGVVEAYLQNTYIKAPFGGIVIKKMAEVGESVAPIPPGVNVSTSSGAIVALADFETLEMEADVNESHIRKLQPRHAAEVTVEAFPDRRLPAVLRQVIPSADRTKATVMVKVTLVEKPEGLKPEMSARVTFLSDAEPVPAAGAPAGPVVTAPRAAVVERGGETRVFEVSGGRAAARRVVLRENRGDRVVVLEGLGGGEVLVLNPPEGLEDGAPVRPK